MKNRIEIDLDLDLNRRIGILIKRLRESKGYSQEDLADLAGLDRTYISGVERCKRNLTIKTLSKILPHICENDLEFFKLLVKDLSNV